MEKLIKFCVHNKLFLIVSELLENAIWEGEFISFGSVLANMESPYNKLEMFLFSSLSKGIINK